MMLPVQAGFLKFKGQSVVGRTNIVLVINHVY